MKDRRTLGNFKSHDLKNKAIFPNHHFWVTARKLNVISNVPIASADKMILGDIQVTVKSIDRTQELANTVRQDVPHTSPKSVFYELQIR